MEKKHKILIILIAFMVLLVGQEGWCTLQYMDGKFTVNGFLQSQFRLHIGGQNPNNNQFRPLSEGNHKVNMFRNMLQLELNYAASDTFSLFSKIKYINESSGGLDSNLRQYEAFPLEYPGDLKLEDDDNMAQIQELYADLTMGPLWLRLGKQQVSWGQTDGFRLLDVINPLDLSWRLIFDAMYEGHDNVRESLWMVRANYNIPCITFVDNPQLELLILPGKFVGDQLASDGAPYNVLPTVVKVHEEQPDGPEVGVKLSGIWKRAEITLNYFRAHSDYGVYLVPGTVVFDRTWGVPLAGDIIPPAGIGREDLMRLNAYGHHPLMSHIGFSFNYDESSFTKGVYRFEFLYEPDKPYERGITIPGIGSFTNAMIEKLGTVKYCLGIDRPFWLRALNPRRTFGFGFQVFQRFVVEGKDKLDENIITLSGGHKVQTLTTTFTLSLDTQYKQDRIHPILFFAWDPRGGFWLAPQCEFQYGDHWRFYLLGTWVGGEDRNAANDGLGGLYWWDELMFRVTYQF
ncbi:MAG: DUF1302 family protein [Pseudomonadota bacterium]